MVAKVIEEALQPIVSFLNDFLEGGLDPLWSVEHFLWKLCRNPTGAGILSYAAVEGRVIACVTITARSLWWRGRTIFGGEFGDAYTDPEYRGIRFDPAGIRFYQLSATGLREWPDDSRTAPESLFVRLAQMTAKSALDQGMELIYGVPNEQSYPRFVKHLGYFTLPIRVASLELPGTLKISDLDKAEEYGFTFTEIHSAIPELDAFWAKVRKQRDFCISRDRSYFQYRFFDNPLATYRLHGLHKSKQLIGLAVTRKHVVLRSRLDICLADWLYDTSEPRAFEMLISYALKQSTRGIDAHLTTWSGAGLPETEVLQRMGFDEAWSTSIVLNDRGIMEDMMRGCKIDLTIATSDNI